MNIEKMKQYSRKFVKERKWGKYHTPKNLALGISIEAAELNEIFHWMSDRELLKMKYKPKLMVKVKDELGDILHYLVRISDVLDIDLEDAFWKKIKKTENKYPKEIVYGKSKKYNEYSLMRRRPQS